MTGNIDNRDPSPDMDEPWDEPPALKTPAQSSILACVEEYFDPAKEEDELDDGDLPALSLNRGSSATRKSALLNGKTSTTKPMSPPSTAGLREPPKPEIREAPSKSAAQLSDWDDDMPDDEKSFDGMEQVQQPRAKPPKRRQPSQRRYEEAAEVSTLDEEQFCDVSSALESMCGTPAGESPVRRPMSPKIILRSIDEIPLPDDPVEEQTAIEVEYVEPERAPKTWSPDKRNSYLSAMAKKAKQDYNNTAPTESQATTPTGPQAKAVQKKEEAKDDQDVYGNFNAAQKRKFLKLVNTGVAPTEAARKVMEDSEAAAQSNASQSSVAQSSESPRRGLAFWKKQSPKPETSSRGKSSDMSSDDDTQEKSARFRLAGRSDSRGSFRREPPAPEKVMAGAAVGAIAASAAVASVTRSSPEADGAEAPLEGPEDESTPQKFSTTPVVTPTTTPKKPIAPRSALRPSKRGGMQNPDGVSVVASPVMIRSPEKDTPSKATARSRGPVSVDGTDSDSDDEPFVDDNDESTGDGYSPNKLDSPNGRLRARDGAAAAGVLAGTAAVAATIAAVSTSSTDDQDAEADIQEQLPKSGSNFYDAVRLDRDELPPESIIETRARKKRSARVAAAAAAATAASRNPKHQGFRALSEKEERNMVTATQDDESPKVTRRGILFKDAKRSGALSPDSASKRRFILPGARPGGFEALDDSAGTPERNQGLAIGAAALGGAAVVGTTTALLMSSSDESSEPPSLTPLSEKDMPPPGLIDDQEAQRLERELLRPIGSFSNALTVATIPEDQEADATVNSSFELPTPASMTTTPRGNAVQVDGDADVDLGNYLETRTTYSTSGDQTSVVSGKSHWTAATGMSNYTTSSRVRRPGAAKERLAKAKKAERNSKNGWHESIKTAAANSNQQWDPRGGFADYIDPDKDKIDRLPSDDAIHVEVKGRKRATTDKSYAAETQGRDVQPPVGRSESAESYGRSMSAESHDEPVVYESDGDQSSIGRYEAVESSDHGVVNREIVYESGDDLHDEEMTYESGYGTRDQDLTPEQQSASRSIVPPPNVSRIVVEPPPTARPDEPMSSNAIGQDERGDDDRPKGWLETMKIASAKIAKDGPGPKWDPENGWQGLTEEFTEELTEDHITDSPTRSPAPDPDGVPPAVVAGGFITVGTAAAIGAAAAYKGESDSESDDDFQPRSPADAFILEEPDPTDQQLPYAPSGVSVVSKETVNEKYMQIGDTGSVKSFPIIQNPDEANQMKKRPTEEPSGAAAPDTFDENVRDEESITEDDTAPLLAAGAVFVSSTDPRGPQVNVVKEKNTEDDSDLFAHDSRTSFPKLEKAVSPTSQPSRRRGHGPVDIDEIDDMDFQDDDDDDDWASEQMMRSAKAVAITKTRTRSGPLPKLDAPKNDTSPLRDRKKQKNAQASPRSDPDGSKNVRSNSVFASAALKDDPDGTVGPRAVSIRARASTPDNQNEGPGDGDVTPKVKDLAMQWEQRVSSPRASPPARSRASTPVQLTPPARPRASPPVQLSASPPARSRASTPVELSASPPVQSRASPPARSRASPPIQSRAPLPVQSRASPPVQSRASPPVQSLAGRNKAPDELDLIIVDRDNRDLSWPTNDDVVEQAPAGTEEWKSFLGKKVKAETAAAASRGRPQREPSGVLHDDDDEDEDEDEDEDDSLFEFRHPMGDQTGAFPTSATSRPEAENFSDVSPIPNQEDDYSEDDRQRNMEQVSDTGTNIEQGSFLKRLQACAAPMMPRQFSQPNDCLNGEGDDAVPSAHLAFMRTNQGSPGVNGNLSSSARYIPPTLCGRPNTIAEDAEAPLSPPDGQRSLNTARSSSGKRSKQRSSPSDVHSLASDDGFGARTSYLEAVAMKAAVSKPKRHGSRGRGSDDRSSARSDVSLGSKRHGSRGRGSDDRSSARSDVSLGSKRHGSRGRGSDERSRSSAMSDVSTSSKNSERWQEFLERKSVGLIPGKQRNSGGPISSTQSDHSSVLISKAAEKYAAQQVEQMLKEMSKNGDSRNQLDGMISPSTLSPNASGMDLPPYDINQVRSDGSKSTRSVKKKNESARAAEELAAARVEAMMAAMTSQTLDEGEI